MNKFPNILFLLLKAQDLPRKLSSSELAAALEALNYRNPPPRHVVVYENFIWDDEANTFYIRWRIEIQKKLKIRICSRPYSAAQRGNYRVTPEHIESALAERMG